MLTAGVCGCQWLDLFSGGATPDEATRDSATGDQASRDQATRDFATIDESPMDYAALVKAHPYDLSINPRFFNKSLTNRKKELPTEELLQNPELPTGCESVAVTMALNSLGFQLGKTDFAEKYLTYGEDVIWDYVGDPTDFSGAGIFPPGLTNCTNNLLYEKKSKYAAYNTMGVEFRELFKLIDSGYPVVLWTTMDYEQPELDGFAFFYQGKEYYWCGLEHCVMLCGYDLDAGTVTVNDPLQGIQTLDLAQMELVYNDMGRLSMTIKTRD